MSSTSSESSEDDFQVVVTLGEKIVETPAIKETPEPTT